MAEEEAAPGGGGGSNKLLLALIILNILTMAGTAAMIFQWQKAEAQKTKLADIVEGQAKGQDLAAIKEGGAVAQLAPDNYKAKERLHKLATFTANLANPRVAKYVRLQVEFVMDEKLSENEVEQKTPQIRDEVLSILNGKRDVEILSTEGKNYLKAELVSSINTLLSTGKVKEVLFTDFLIN